MDKSRNAWSLTYDEFRDIDVAKEVEQLFLQFEIGDKKKCECGSETAYGEDTTHSSWCPKHEEE